MRGIAKANYGERAGIIHHSSAANHNFLYETSLTKDAKWNVGDRFVMGDGRVFRYGKATNIVTHASMGLKFWGQLADGIDYTAPLQTQDVGDLSIRVDAGAAAAVAEDELKGGYVIIHTHGLNNHQFRGVLGNSLADADGYTTIYLDAPLKEGILTTHGVEVHPNPYMNLQSRHSPDPGDDHSSVAGMPNVRTVAANQYLWIQTWGPRWVNPQHFTYTNTADRRELIFDNGGEIDYYDKQAQTTSMMQRAGFIIYRDADNGHAKAVIMLQISI